MLCAIIYGYIFSCLSGNAHYLRLCATVTYALCYLWGYKNYVYWILHHFWWWLLCGVLRAGWAQRPVGGPRAKLHHRSSDCNWGLSLCRQGPHHQWRRWYISGPYNSQRHLLCSFFIALGLEGIFTSISAWHSWVIRSSVTWIVDYTLVFLWSTVSFWHGWSWDCDELVGHGVCCGSSFRPSLQIETSCWSHWYCCNRSL